MANKDFGGDGELGLAIPGQKATVPLSVDSL